MDIYGNYEPLLKAQVWASKNEAKMWKTLSEKRKAEFLKNSRPHVYLGFSSVPSEFQGWGPETTVDFHGENWPDVELASRVMSTFQAGAAVAIPKGGKNFAISFPNGMQQPALITEINDADARDMVSMPVDWEKYVEVLNG